MNCVMYGARIMEWRGLLLIDQTDEVHRRVEAFLNMLLARAIPPQVPERWRLDVREGLKSRVSFDFQGASVVEVAKYLSEVTGTTVIVPRADDIDTPINVKLADVTLERALETLGRIVERHVVPQEGAVMLREYPELVVRPYDVRGGLVAVDEDGLEEYDDLISVIQQSASPYTWSDIEGVVMAPWDGLLIVRNTAEAHEKIAEFLDTARRALAK